MSAELLGARLRRVDAPAPDLLALTLASPALRGTLLIGLAPPARGIGFCDQRPRGNTPGPLLLRARRCLEGGRLIELRRPAPDRLWIGVERGGERHALEIRLSGARGNALLRDGAGTLLAALHPPGDEPERTPGSAAGPEALGPIAELRAHGDRMLEALGVSAFERDKLQLARALRAAQRRVERRLTAIEADRARADRVGELRRNAGLLLTHLHAIGDATGPLELRDEAADPPVDVRLEIDPALGAKAQADAWFGAARKLERGAAISARRAQEAQAELDALRALGERVQSAQDAGQLGELREQARSLGVTLDPAGVPARKQAARRPYREFKGSGARSILVGKGAEDNDALTLEHARPHDLWLHARDDAGAHVVVPLERGEACPPELLADAATLAAHFSQARGQTRVDVIYTERRYVRKPRKIGPGKVVLLRERVFRLDLQPQRLRRLLASER